MPNLGGASRTHQFTGDALETTSQTILAALGGIASDCIITGTSPDSGGVANTSTRIELDGSASAVDGAYDPAAIYITGGTGFGQARQIWEYDGTNKYAYINRDWKVTPDNTSEYCVVYFPGDTHVNEGLAQGGGPSTITLNALASAQNSLYLGQMIFIVAGTGADQARMCVGYVGATKVVTVDSPWIVQPDNTSVYATYPYPGFVHGVPAADSAANVLVRDALGQKGDAGSLALNTSSVTALARKGAKEAWEIEHHFHVRERWLGLAGAAEGWAPYALPVGDGGTFGAWTEILDAADTPIIAGSTHYDPHRILLRDIPETKEAILIQFAWGASGAAGYGDGDYTEVYDLPEKPADGKTAPLDVKFPRLPTDTLLWARGKQENADAADGTIDFFIGIHEYTDPDT